MQYIFYYLQTLSWLRTEAEEGLQNHNNLQKKSTSLAEIKQQNQNFEPFYFNAMVRLLSIRLYLNVLQSNKTTYYYTYMSSDI